MTNPVFSQPRAALGDILGAVRTRLSTVTGIPAGRIRYVARRKDDNLPSFDADQQILLRDRGFITTGGNNDPQDYRIYRKLGVMIRTRNELSEADDDESWLTNAALGNAAFEDLAFESLNNFLPLGSNGVPLLFEEMKIEPGTARLADGAGWGAVELEYRMGTSLPMPPEFTVP